MNTLGLVRRLGPMDLRTIRRDPLSQWTIGLPFLVALLLRWGVPALGEWLRVRFAVDLVPYYPLIAGAYMLVAPSLVGFIVGFLLLDERDDRILDALRVTPVSMDALLLYRLGVPLVAGMLVTVAGYGLAGLVALPTPALMAASALGACSGPLLALVLVGFADNKVSGFALAKLLTAVSNLSLVGWFVPMPWQVAAGGLPSYWPMKIVWQAAQGAPWIEYALAGMFVNGVVAWLLLRRFHRVLPG